MSEIRQPGRFLWERSGRMFVARFGSFTACVVMDGSERKGTLRFRTGDLFGNPFMGSREWTTCDDAILEMEPLIVQASIGISEAVRIGMHGSSLRRISSRRRSR